jgi:hypothetical protein
MSRTYQVMRVMCSGLAPPSASTAAMFCNAWRVCATKPSGNFSFASQPTMPPTNTNSPRALMPLE